ncbi:hypothetical protein H072_7390 [Dactylellina haptotyla CBS 200.50]|uniref:Uncharacterized protein n=1 Tax=Dactylellina haptotyla (strain CBS 200.50) TaxID=1284197 RepID=S8BHZ6_DACHA|nr:hypothetical protein H072_7390 [Dactylellina haptotyla CBS 200.50]
MRTSRSTLLLFLAASSANASPAPIWDRILTTFERISPSWLSSPQSPLPPSDLSPQPGTLVTTHLPAQTTTIYATTHTPLPLPPAWTVNYPEEEEDDDEEALKKRQCYNSGLDNNGCYNSGNGNTGNGNSGNYNCGNGNSGNYNNNNGQSGNGGTGQCGNVVISQSAAYVYPAPSTVVVQVAPVTQVITVQAPVVYTTYVVYAQPPATTVIYQQPQVVPIVAQETYAPRGCAYWEALGYRCSAGVGMESLRGSWRLMAVVGGLFWGVWIVVM